MTRKQHWDAPSLVAALAEGRIIPLGEAEWAALADGFPVARSIETGIAGTLLVVRRPVPGRRAAGWAVVERPQPGERVVRPLPDQRATKALVDERLRAYERMWDG
jgi:hypothetical protein